METDVSKRVCLSALGVTPTHQFRLLSNHPSLPALEDLPLLKQRSQAFAQKPLRELGDKTVVTDRLKRLMCWLLASVHNRIWFKNLPTQFFTTTGAEIDTITRNMAQQVDERFDTLTISSASCLIHTILKNEIITAIAPTRPELMSLKREALEPSIVLPLSSHNIFLHVFMELLPLQPGLENILLHFADSNYTVTIPHAQEALHYCLWYSSFSGQWEIVKVPENNRWYRYLEVLSLQYRDFFAVREFCKRI